MAKINISVNSDESAAGIRNRIAFGAKGNLKSVFGSIADGIRQNARIVCNYLAEDDVAASATVTFSGAGAANDTVLINGVTFTAKAASATGNEWNVGGSATLSGAALAAAINGSASALISEHVTASAAAGVVTVTAKRKGLSGNTITIAEGVDGSSHMVVSSARLVGGTEDTGKSESFQF